MLHILSNSRVSPLQPAQHERAVPLSLLDATTAKFGLTSAIWLLESPSISPPVDFGTHLSEALAETLNAYPQWCGHLKSILSLDEHGLPPETASFPTHAKRYGRVYVHHGTRTDPGVEFIEASSTATVDALYSATSPGRRPVWSRRSDESALSQFVPPTSIVQPLEPDQNDAPIMAVQWTVLACRGFVLAAKIAHPLADITSLTRFVRDWASVSRAMLTDSPLPVLSPVFDPARLDASAAGDINANSADPAIMEDALGLPLHRYDCWAPPAQPPAPFPPDLPLAVAAKPLPCEEWNSNLPGDQCTVHFSKEQIEVLWQTVIKTDHTLPPGLKLSKHDALLAHIWSCVVRARGLQEDQGSVHCDLVLGTRPAFGLDGSFMGSPTMMLNIEMPASQVVSNNALSATAHRVRETVTTVNDSRRLAAHLHSIAYETSPQRLWQAFLGQRHILVTTWARAGIYDIEFGLRCRIRYADGVVPCLNGCILIVDGPPSETTLPADGEARGWTDNGVDVTIPLLCEDMQRLLQDPLLLPRV